MAVSPSEGARMAGVVKIKHSLKGRLATSFEMDPDDPSLEERIKRSADNEACRAVVALDAGRTMWSATIEPPEQKAEAQHPALRCPVHGRDIHEVEAWALAGNVGDILFGWEEERISHLRLGEQAANGDVYARLFMECIEGRIRYAKDAYVYWATTQTLDRLCMNFEAILRISEGLAEMGTIAGHRLRSIFDTCRSMPEHDLQDPMTMKMSDRIGKCDEVFPQLEDEPNFAIELIRMQRKIRERNR